MGKHWSLPTVKGMFAHLYAADAIWLARWQGVSPTRMAGDANFPTMPTCAPAGTRWRGR